MEAPRNSCWCAARGASGPLKPNEGLPASGRRGFGQELHPVRLEGRRDGARLGACARLLPAELHQAPLEFGREREAIDLSKVKLTHYMLKERGKVPMLLEAGEKPLLYPITEAGGGSVQEEERARLHEVIEKVNTLFKGELSDQDKLVYVNNVLMGKLLESPTLAEQAANNTKEQFANSPDLQSEIMNAIIGAFEAHTLMSTQALNSEAVRDGIKDILLNHAQLWEALRSKVGAGRTAGAEP